MLYSGSVSGAAWKVEKVTYETPLGKSDKTSSIIFLVLYLTFFNDGVLILLHFVMFTESNCAS